MKLLCLKVLLILTGACFASSHHPQKFLETIRSKSDAAEQIYKHFCVNCHQPKPLLPLGAPTIGDKKAWEKRLTHGLAPLLKRTQEGVGLMPARGGCFECSDEQLEMVVNYMIKPQKNQKD
jgi:cytochrome c5